MDKVIVSVVIPVYNAEKYLGEALDDVLSQTFTDIEVLCVDDGSTDSSLRIIQDYQKKDNRIKLLHQIQKSKGAALARNMGLKNAVGEYVVFWDADDLFESDLIESAYQKAQETKAEIVTFGASFFHTGTGEDIYAPAWGISNIFEGRETVDPKEFPNSLFQNFKGSAWVYLFSRQFLEDNGLSFYSVYTTDDIEFTYTAIACAQKVAVVKKRFVHYRRDAVNNQTSNLKIHPETCWEALLHFKHTLENKGKYEYYKVSFVNYMMQMVSGNYLRTMDTMDSFRQLYYMLQKKCLEPMGAYDIPDEEYTDFRIVEMRNHIMHDSPEEFLVFCNHRDNLFHYNTPALCLPKEWMGKKQFKVVLYGAGEWGRKVFASILEDENVSISHWVDKNYRRYGYPVESPDVLRYDKDYDLIFIAILSRETCNSVREWLFDIGVNRDVVFSR